jgi:hypothetical protein
MYMKAVFCGGGVMIGSEYRTKRIGDHGEPCGRPVSERKDD